jgi:hypothetical protein
MNFSSGKAGGGDIARLWQRRATQSRRKIHRFISDILNGEGYIVLYDVMRLIYTQSVIEKGAFILVTHPKLVR